MLHQFGLYDKCQTVALVLILIVHMAILFELQLLVVAEMLLLINAISTAAYAVVAASKFSGLVSENNATATAKMNVEMMATIRLLTGTVPTAMIHTGTTRAKPPNIAKANRRHAFFVSS